MTAEDDLKRIERELAAPEYSRYVKTSTENNRGFVTQPKLV